MNKILIKNIKYLHLDDDRINLSGPVDVLIFQDRFYRIESAITDPEAEVVDGSGRYLLPGLIQTHVHLCQTIFRSQADDVPLLTWLNQTILPMESCHSFDSLYWSSIQGLAELIDSGTTTIVDMATNHHTEAVFQAMADMGIRGYSGKMMMDMARNPRAAGLVSETEAALEESLQLMRQWHDYQDGRLNYILNPRFAVTCSRSMLISIGEFAAQHQLFVHTHASENTGEVDLIRQETGMVNVEYLDSVGLLNPSLLLAHCIWLNENEFRRLQQSGTTVLHCPSSNLKLGSGIAQVVKMLEMGIPVTLGADGAACSNTLSVWNEMRLAALLQKVNHGPDAIHADQIVKMVTTIPAKSLNREHEIGNIRIGMKADAIILNPQSALSMQPFSEDRLSSYLAYSAGPQQVESVLINGKFCKRDFKLIMPYTEEQIITRVIQELKDVQRRSKSL